MTKRTLFATLFYAIITSATVALSAAQRDISVEPTSRKGQRWAILVGVNDYVHIDNLKYCVNDVSTLRDELLKNGYEEKRMFCLTTRSEKGPSYQPTYANLRRIVSEVFKLLQNGDQILIVLSGHGLIVEGKSYFCLEDTDPQNLETTSINIEKLYVSLDQSNATNKLLIVDACRNRPATANNLVQNEAISAMSKNPLEGIKVADRIKGIEKLPLPPPGIVLLSSCNEGEFSFEDRKLEHGVFTYFLIEAIRGNADTNKDGFISLLELTSYVCQETPLHTLREFRAVQTPYFRGNATDYFIATAKRKTEQVTPVIDPHKVDPIPAAEDLSVALRKSGLVGRYDTQVGALRSFAWYGNDVLKKELEDAESFERNARATEKVVAQEGLERVKARIVVAQEEIAKKTFVAKFTYSANDYDMESLGEGVFRGLLKIYPGFTDKRPNNAAVSFSDPNITLRTIDTSYSGSAVELSVSGPTKNMEELVYKHQNFEAFVWFTNLRAGFSYYSTPTADILRIEIVKKGTRSPVDDGSGVVGVNPNVGVANAAPRFGWSLYLAEKVKYDGANSSFTMVITKFNSSPNSKITEISFPEGMKVTGKITTETPRVRLAVSGDEANIRELVQSANNNGKYQAKVWFINLRNGGNGPVADAQKIEIVRVR